MSRYEQHHGGHLMLERLAGGQATMSQLQWVQGDASANTRRKRWYPVHALIADGLVREVGKFFSITADGLDALEDLRAGFVVDIAGAQPRSRSAAA